MRAAVHAEIVSGGTEMVLMAGGDNATIRAVARGLQTCTPRLAKTDPPGGLRLPLTWAAVVQIAAQVGRMRDVHWFPGPRLKAWIMEQVRARTTPRRLVYQPPAGLTPYPWQAEGARMIADTGSALLTDEPGTGKTITTILGICELKARGYAQGQVVVVVPASVVDPWVEAFHTWSSLRAVAWRGPARVRHALAGHYDAYVVSYDTARVDAADVSGPLVCLGASVVVIDECHQIKNHQTKRSRAARRLAERAQHAIALSGTPITHHPDDLWPTLAAIAPGAWPSRERWVHRYCDTLQGDYREEILGLNQAYEPEFRETMPGQMRRVAKADVLTTLPPKVYSTRVVDLPSAWRKAYDAMESTMLAELPDGEELSVMSVLSKMVRLSQLACAPADVETTIEDDEHGLPSMKMSVTLKAPSWKVDALLEIAEERPGQQLVVFAPSRQLIELAGAALTEAGYRVGYITGTVTGTARSAVVKSFQSGELDVACVTTGAGGVGLTLTAACTVVFLQRPWSLVEAAQAEDRCHRIGSEKHDSIEVIDIVARNTIDSRVRLVLKERARALSDLLKDPRIAAEILGGADERNTDV